MLRNILDLLTKKISLKVRADLECEIEDLKFMLGQVLSQQRTNQSDFKSAEFQVYSQWGDDGLIQYVIRRISEIEEVFIEFGVEDYKESNTRFLLKNNNWKGLVFDGDETNVKEIKEDTIYWKNDLTARSAFITAENINDLIREEGLEGDIGLLHIDIDGNDYWVWNALETVRPSIVIMEYNSLFGVDRSITVPYNPDFRRQDSHYSHLLAGASLPALFDLGERKGYTFIGCNSSGNNAYFVKNQYAASFDRITLEQGYVRSKFRESRSREGNLSYLSFDEAQSLLRGCEVFNVSRNRIEKF